MFVIFKKDEKSRKMKFLLFRIIVSNYLHEIIQTTNKIKQMICKQVSIYVYNR